MFARLDRLIVKLFQAEERLCLHLLIDISGSMGLGSPSKLDYALRAAAALAYVGLVEHERVAVGLFNNALRRVIVPVSGRSQFVPLLKSLGGVRAEGTTDFKSALSAYAAQSRTPGLAILISDLFDADDFQLGIAALRRRRFDVRVLHVLAQEEVVPSLKGNLKLTDIESYKAKQIFADKQALEAYAANLARYCQDIERFCLQRGVAYYRATTSTPFEALLFRHLRERQFLR
jgi:uncharacterized protein (DUF58 family)